MNDSFLSRFPKQLGYWAIHGSIQALPCFVIAVNWFDKFGDATAISAMVLGLAIHIPILALASSLLPLTERNHPIGRAIRMGVTIRSLMAATCAPLGITQLAIFFPDAWCGGLAVCLTELIVNIMPRSSSYPVYIQNEGGFLPILTITLLTGVFLTFLLLMISFFCLVVLQARERRSFLRSIAAPAPR